MTEPSSQEEPQESKTKGERWVTKNEWIVCSVLAGASAFTALRFGAIVFVEVFIGRLAAFVIIWVIVRGIYRWIANKRTAA
jgi:hypothetical protein